MIVVPDASAVVAALVGDDAVSRRARDVLSDALLVAPALPFTWWMIPETKGRSREEIELAWQRSTG